MLSSTNGSAADSSDPGSVSLSLLTNSIAEYSC